MEFNATFLAVIVSFIVFVFLMNKVLYAPMQKIVKERNEFIDGNFSTAEVNNKKAEELSEQRDEKLKEAKDDARNEYNESLDEFKTKKSDIIKQAQTESSEEIFREFENLENISNDTKEKLKSKMTDLANDIVEKVLGYRSNIQGFDNDMVNEILYHKEG